MRCSWFISNVFDYIEWFHNPRMQRRIDARAQAFLVDFPPVLLNLAGEATLDEWLAEGATKVLQPDSVEVLAAAVTVPVD